MDLELDKYTYYQGTLVINKESNTIICVNTPITDMITHLPPPLDDKLGAIPTSGPLTTDPVQVYPFTGVGLQDTAAWAWGAARA